jgi:UDP-N-acetylmuramyl pentapeptide phosphotransferase/UDP-N-acetylglucosamine-1-phosphate transferase
MDMGLSISAIGYILGILGAWGMSLYGRRLRLVDHPNERSSHSVPIPRGGGMGIWVSALIAGEFLLHDHFFVFMVFGIGALSLLADYRDLSSKVRLIIQLCIVCFVTFSYMPSAGGVWYAGLFVFWVLLIGWTLNLYNFMDGIDGLAGLTGLIGFGSVAIFFYYIYGDEKIALFSFTLALACLGFLPFNFPKARTFMGDVGSVTIGFVFAVFIMWGSRTFEDLICLMSFLFLFYADELVTTILRVRKGENLLKPHRSHFYQVLVNEVGISHVKVSLAYSIIQVMVCGVMLLLRAYGGMSIVIFPVLCFIAFCVTNYIVRVRIS